MEIAAPPALNTRTHNVPLMTYGYCASWLTRLVSIQKDFCLTKCPITILMQMAMWRSKSIIAIIYWFWISWPALSHRFTIITLVCPIKCNPSIILADVANICFVQREVIRYFGIFTGDIHCPLCSIITELSGESDIEHLPGISTRFTFNPE
jgi:hypothetical protein